MTSHEELVLLEDGVCCRRVCTRRHIPAAQQNSTATCVQPADHGGASQPCMQRLGGNQAHTIDASLPHCTKGMEEEGCGGEGGVISG